jgi:AcrR family transcriptional regulator
MTRPAATRNGPRTRERICAEALALFAERGVDGATVRDIAQAVGVAEGALYRHFRSKEDIARAIFVEHYAALARDVLAIGAAASPFPRRVEALVRRFTDLFDEDPALFAFLLINQHRHLGEISSSPEENPVAALRAMLQAAQERGDVRPGNPDLLAAMALGLVVQPAVFRLYGRLTGPLVQAAPDIAQAALAMLEPSRVPA